ncbi:hypothetical protein Premu_0483 [Hallella multisaccharivorax DSM 17128]|uniref:Peptidase S26 domain-containing protein n=1 Tax=Hallella multisaccharivorax DSM 17128 TaxID=688246 RepID=F8NBT9_9BACT|nr:S26 family signal peptidase [Hallella multisaccharivorax]EGN55965.1 hypothetical protein Premu_0483 [Hallella multisaccharivorax DSM 17128]
MARQLLKFILALAVAVAIVVVIRMFAFTICTVPTPIGQELRTGNRMIVNKLTRCHDLRQGDLIVFTVSGEAPAISLIGPPQEIGMVVNLPGDTITVKRRRWLIPIRCCNRCPCRDCKVYLVDTGHGYRLVHRHQIIGKAVRLFK